MNKKTHTGKFYDISNVLFVYWTHTVEKLKKNVFAKIRAIFFDIYFPNFEFFSMSKVRLCLKW